MNKTIIMICMTVGTIIGSILPTWLGDKEPFDVWSIVGGVVGGLAGIWLGVKLSKRF